MVVVELSEHEFSAATHASAALGLSSLAMELTSFLLMCRQD